MPGDRGAKDKLTDLGEAKQSIERAIELLVPEKPLRVKKTELAGYGVCHGDCCPYIVKLFVDHYTPGPRRLLCRPCLTRVIKNAN
jgi:hypothetical protein